MTRAPSLLFASRLPAALAAALWLAVVPESGMAQYPGPGGNQPDANVPGTSSGRPRFSVDATVEPSGMGMPAVRLDYRLARSELLFERRPSGYHAAYELRVILYQDKGGRQAAGDVFVRELNVRAYAETRLLGADVVDHVELPVPPGKYRAQVVVNDLVAERMSGTEIPIEVPSQPASPLWFSDLSFGTAKATFPDTMGLRGRIDLNPSRRYSNDIAALAVYAELVDARPEAARDASYRVEYRILNEAQDRVLQRDTTISRQSARTPLLIVPRIASLAPGPYRFLLELKAPTVQSGGKPQTIRREKAFDVVQSAASIAADPRGTLEVLTLIADKDERREMDDLKTDAQRREFWERFWNKRGPEKRDEFYRRVQYAEQNFSVAGPGWRTDMGRTYIIHGQPDEIVRSPFNYDRPPEEIWYYYQPRMTFYFIDKDGFGRFELDRLRNP